MLKGLLSAGNPSSSRFINIIVAITGAALLFFWARNGGEMSWPWAVCFLGYLAYGAGPYVYGKFLETIQSKFTGQKESNDEPKTS